jgi:hypothetical protein
VTGFATAKVKDFKNAALPSFGIPAYNIMWRIYEF